jgi:t-SNARE complex subunit (syntaxin)
MNRPDWTIYGILVVVLLMVAFVVFGFLHFAGVTR